MRDQCGSARVAMAREQSAWRQKVINRGRSCESMLPLAGKKVDNMVMRQCLVKVATCALIGSIGTLNLPRIYHGTKLIIHFHKLIEDPL